MRVKFRLYQYPTQEEIDAAVLHVLKHAFFGKDETRRPKGLTAHQVVQRLPDLVGWPLVMRGGVGGLRGSTGPLNAASQVVRDSMKRHRKAGLVRVRWIDLDGFQLPNRYDHSGKHPLVIPSNPVCAVYEYIGPRVDLGISRVVAVPVVTA